MLVSTKDAVAALNTLQSNASVLKEIRSRGGKNSEAEFANMEKYLSRIGISVSSSLQRVTCRPFRAVATP